MQNILARFLSRKKNVTEEVKMEVAKEVVDREVFYVRVTGIKKADYEIESRLPYGSVGRISYHHIKTFIFPTKDDAKKFVTLEHEDLFEPEFMKIDFNCFSGHLYSSFDEFCVEENIDYDGIMRKRAMDKLSVEEKRILGVN